MQYCALEKEGFLGTFYERETPSSSSWAEAAKGVAALRAENRHERAVPRRGVYAAVRGWENARSSAVSAGENDDDGSKIPGGVQPRPRGQLDEAG